MTNLYEMTSQMIGLKRLIDDGEMDEQALADTLDGLEGDLKVKAENLLGYVANVGSDVDAIDAEIKRLTGRKKVMVNNQNRLREYLRYNMDVGGIDKIECPLFTITLRKATQVVSVGDIEQLPDEYIRTTVAPDKVAIKAALKAGIDVPGCEFQEGKRGLMIK